MLPYALDIINFRILSSDGFFSNSKLLYGRNRANSNQPEAGVSQAHFYRSISTSRCIRMRSRGEGGATYAYPWLVIKCRGMRRLYPRVFRFFSFFCIWLFHTRLQRGCLIYMYIRNARATRCAGMKAVIF